MVPTRLVISGRRQLSHISGDVSRGRFSTLSSVVQDASRPAPPAPAPSMTEATLLAAGKKPVQDARTRLLAERLRAIRLEELQKSTAKGKPEQRWSNRTMIALATAVGASTFIIGTYQGYNAGKKHAFEQIALGKVNVPATNPDSTPLLEPSPAEHTASLSTPSNSTEGLRFPFIASDALELVRSFVTNLVTGSVHCEVAPLQKGCELVEVVQYHCELQKKRIVCQPLDRIFRKCGGRPAVEVTHIVAYDDTGAPYLPEHLAEAMPPSQHWHELRAPDI